MFKEFNYHDDVSVQEAPGSAVTHKGAFDQSAGMRQDESWLCLADDDALLCTINDSRLKAGNKLLVLDDFFFFMCQHAFRRPNKTGLEGVAPKMQRGTEQEMCH